MRGNFEVGNKQKKVDSIVAPADSLVIPAEAGIQDSEGEKPLLSIIEPEAISSVIPAKAGIQKTKTEVLDSSSDQNDEGKVNFWRRHKRVLLTTLGSFFVILSISGLVAGGAYAYEKHYTDKTFPGVVVWDQDMGGKNVKEVQEAITAKTKAYTLTIKAPDQDYVATAEDLGVIYDSETMISMAFTKGRNENIWMDNFNRLRLLSTKISWAPWQEIIHASDMAVSPTFSVNQEIFDQYVTKMAENINITAQDSEVKVTAGSVQLKPAIYGREVKIDDLKNQIKASIDNFQTEEIAIKTEILKPAIIDTAAQEVMIQAQSVMKRPVILNYEGTEYRPNQETVASWISFVKKTGDSKYTLFVDTSKMKGYFDFLGTKINVYPVARKVRVENETKETESRPGSNGLLIDRDKLGQIIALQLPVQASVTATVPTYVAPYKTEYERVIIADWAKYIDINIGTQTMTACEKGGVNCHQWRVMTGKNSTPTPTGTFLVMGKSRNFWMSGLQGTPGYYRLWVPYATWFKAGGYAIHSASWRNNDPNSSNGFGNKAYTWNGSHGCVNSPDDAAAYIYNWADVGTPVTVHN